MNAFTMSIEDSGFTDKVSIDVVTQPGTGSLIMLTLDQDSEHPRSIPLTTQQARLVGMALVSVADAQEE